MEYLETLSNQMPPSVLYILQILITCLESFFVNVYVAGKCMFTLFSDSSSIMGVSLGNYNKIIDEELRRQSNPSISYLKIGVCTIFCLHIAYTITINLLFPLLWNIAWWVFWWSVVFSSKELAIKGLEKMKVV